MIVSKTQDMSLSFTEENYLKTLLHLTFLTRSKSEVGTNEIASYLDLKPATVNDMLKKLKEKQLVDYERYGKISLTESGKLAGMEVIRKHRLWETFLFKKLSFSWDEVHEVAEQLEHIQSTKLVDRLDAFLDFPKVDPHGDPIPNAKGEIEIFNYKSLNDLELGQQSQLMGVKDNTSSFLQYVNKLGLRIGEQIELVSREEYDDLLHIRVNQQEFTISKKFAENIFVV
jgi:DtxR family Mn-dependent transcriptional regulator